MSKEQNKNYGKSIRTKLLNVARKENVFNPNRSLGRLMYNFNNCLQSFAFYKASFACF